MSKPINILHKFSLLYFGSAGSALLLGVALGASPNMIAVYLLISAFCLMRLFYFKLSLKQVKTGAFDEKAAQLAHLSIGYDDLKIIEVQLNAEISLTPK